MEIHIAVWNSTLNGDDTFMGHFNIPIGQQQKSSIDRWFSLMPRPSHFHRSTNRGISILKVALFW